LAEQTGCGFDAGTSELLKYTTYVGRGYTGSVQHPTCVHEASCCPSPIAAGRPVVGPIQQVIALDFIVHEGLLFGALPNDVDFKSAIDESGDLTGDEGQRA